MREPHVGVVVCNWNRREDTLECLASVSRLGGARLSVVVVDNSSTDGSVPLIERRFPDFTVIENSENLGFAEGNNIGIDVLLERGVDYVLLLNNDAIADPSLIEEFLAAAASQPKAGVFGARIYHHERPDQIQYGGVEWQRANGVFEIVDKDRTIESSSIREITSVPWACGCALFARADVFRKAGLFDPRFFLLFEEVDWCYRARRAGFDVVVVPAARVWHKGSQSFAGGESGPLRSYYIWRNRMLWMKREFGIGERTLIYGRAIAPQLGRRFRTIVSRRSGRQARRVARAEVLGLIHYFTRRFGPAPSSLSG